MGEQTYTERNDIHLMPWTIRASADDNLTKDCILVAVMNGSEMVSISLHVDSPDIAE